MAPRKFGIAVSLDGVWGATPGQAAELEKRAWEKLWVGGPPPPPEPAVAERSPTALVPITGDSLVAILKGVPKDKALGPDGWSFGELLDLGPSGLGKLGEIYQLVERSAAGGPPLFLSYSASSSPKKGPKMLRRAQKLLWGN